jgi:hypothetical protein
VQIPQDAGLVGLVIGVPICAWPSDELVELIRITQAINPTFSLQNWILDVLRCYFPTPQKNKAIA